MVMFLILVTTPLGYNAHAQEHVVSFSGGDDLPIINDPNLKVELIVQGLDLPTTIAFLGPDDILVLEKDKGTVQRIVNGKMLPEPLLDVNVATSVERCMCGIAVSQINTGSTTYVFLYYTEAELTDSEDVTQEKAPLGNRLYRYELVNNKLINPVLLLDLPAIPGPRHNGGAIMIGPDNNLYVPIGDVDGSHTAGPGETKAQNYVDGAEPDGRSGLLRITQDGQPVGIGILGESYPLNLYYAYGIRNSFGFDFDPITGNIWDTENGPGDSDEINLVEPGFNSGWQEIQGMAGMASFENYFDANNLVQFEGKGKYSDPELVWLDTEGPTAAKFLNSDKLGTQYVNDLFVGDVHNGRIYHFDLNEDRTELVLEGPLADKIIDTPSIEEFSNIIFGEGFGGITDLEVGPDGYLYVVSIGQGAIYRIVQTSNGPSTIATAEDVEPPDVPEAPEITEAPEEEDLEEEDLEEEDLEEEDLEEEDLEEEDLEEEDLED
jgi:glucose/arabinose dehydrogenase